MLRTIFMIGLIVFAGLFAMNLVFGVLGLLFAILFKLIFLAIPMMIVGGLAYILLKVFAPDTARDLKSRFGGR